MARDQGTAHAAEALRRSIRGDVLAPGDQKYDAARRVWNAMVDRRPALIVRCGDASDVVAAVRLARSQGLEIGVKCGGHSIIGQAVPGGGLMIDLGPMNAVEVDPERRIAQVQGGALLGALDRASQAHGLATTAGNVSHTGVGGLTLGGGMGWLARQLGMACDNVLEYEVVTSDGTLMTASATENADLFWGLRGGGGNFGVVTRFTFRLHPIAGQVLSVDLFYELEHGIQVLQGWREFVAEAPRQATPTAWTGTAGEWPFLAEELHGQQLVNAGFIWVGDPEEGRRVIAPLREFAPVVAEVVDESTYLELQSGSDEAMRHGLRRYWKDHFFRELSDSAIEAFLGRGGEPDDGAPLPNGSLQAYGGAIGDVAFDESAFSHRDAMVEFVTMAGWEDPAEDARHMGASRRYAAAMQPHASGAYVNGLADEGAAGIGQAYRAETLTRLTAIKDRYDPDNVFHLNHNVRPSAAS
jgi:FAD/FMN-containing dehydrogenase